MHSQGQLQQPGEHSIRVCFFGTYRSEYTRHQVMLSRLRSAGVEVFECHAELWSSPNERVQAASGGWHRLGFLAKVIGVYFRLIRTYFKQAGEYDVLWIGYPGLFDALLGKLLCQLRHKPLVWDICLSVYLVSLERGLDKTSQRTIAGLHWAEQTSARLSDLLLLETQAYIRWFAGHYGLPEKRFRLAPLGADDAFVRGPLPGFTSHTDQLVLFYGTFHPNAGVPYIVEAARLLQDYPAIRFELVGDGPELEMVEGLLQEYGLVNVQRLEWMSRERLIEKIASADICLGSFGDTTQSQVSVHNKIYESLAMSKPVITGDSPAVREILQHEIDIYLVERASPQAIAEAVLRLARDQSLKDMLSANGRQLVVERFTNQALGAQLKSYLCELVEGRAQA